jgi:histidyl-tRNA synthetase
MGQERLVELMRNQAEPEVNTPHVYLVMSGEGTTAGGLKLAETLRENVVGIRVQSNLGGGSFKSQFKRADRSGAPLALVLGEDELRQGQVTVKHLRCDTEQENIALNDLEIWFRNYLGVLN